MRDATDVGVHGLRVAGTGAERAAGAVATGVCVDVAGPVICRRKSALMEEKVKREKEYYAKNEPKVVSGA